MAEKKIKRCMNCMEELPGGLMCPYCRFNNANPIRDWRALPPNTSLAENRYLVGNYISSNSEGITYIGFDGQKSGKVWIREFMPFSMASRSSGNALVPYGESLSQFKTLKIDFSDMYTVLRGRKNTGGIVPVLDIFEQNNTIYAVLEYIESITLEQFLGNIDGGRLEYRHASVIFEPLLDTLSDLHNNNLVHRGISPQTILIDTEGSLRLTGFCISSVRTLKSELEAEIFPGYAAPEQYNVTSWQGTWTDVYSVAAALYRTLTGVAPQESIERKVNDELLPAAVAEPSVPKNVSAAIGRAMTVEPDQRIETIDIFSEILKHGPGDYRKNKAMTKQVDFSRGITPENAPRKKRRKGTLPYTLAAMFVTAVVLLIGMQFVIRALDSARKQNAAESSSSAPVSSEAEREYKIPNFTTKRYDAIIYEDGYQKFFFLGEPIRKHSGTYPSGMIIDQDVEPGTVVTESKPVTIIFTVSTGPIPIPDMTGWTKSDAAAQLASLEIEDYKFTDIYSDSIEEGRVVRYSRSGDSVTVMISMGKEPESSGEEDLTSGAGSIEIIGGEAGNAGNTAPETENPWPYYNTQSEIFIEATP
ncbi:MAG: PASTA domain-containing protein [Oscillospiraceae bacterium]|jgi:serine/threonine-protein kinase|nr:PASTA domain-containing protein [Oscillospiraceae bacterium]